MRLATAVVSKDPGWAREIVAHSPAFAVPPRAATEDDELAWCRPWRNDDLPRTSPSPPVVATEAEDVLPRLVLGSRRRRSRVIVREAFAVVLVFEAEPASAGVAVLALLEALGLGFVGSRAPLTVGFAQARSIWTPVVVAGRGRAAPTGRIGAGSGLV